MKATPLRCLTGEIIPGGGEKGRGEGGTVAQNNRCMVMRAQSKYSE